MVRSGSLRDRRALPVARVLAVIALLLLGGQGIWTGGAPASARPARSVQDDPNCPAETEPNNAPETAPTRSGAFCVTGRLPDDDQDITLWTVASADAAKRWTVTLDGVPNTVTAVAILPVASAPGATPITAGAQILKIETAPATRGPVVASNLLLPVGTYIVGVSRSGTADSSPPPSTGYRLAIAEGDPLPPNGDVEPNTDQAGGSPVADAFALSGDLQGSEDWYGWTLSAAAAAKGWALSLAGPVGETLTLDLYDAGGLQLTSVTTDFQGHVLLPDLALPAGRYGLHIGSNADHPRPYALSAAEAARPVSDLEPNDRPEHASTFDPTHAIVTGRIG
ncbi:MAG: hypothetical protein ACR2OO_02395, partial [Thermomicrobiales bacterium]